MASLKLAKSVFGVNVKIKISGETGTIMAFSLHKRQNTKQFLVEYCAADGRAAENWFAEDQLEVIPD